MNENSQGIPQMPGMPQAPVQPVEKKEENSPVLQVPEIEKEVEKESSNEIELSKPVIENASDNNSVVEVSNLSGRAIEVVATRPGFYNQTRLKEGQEFVIAKFDHLGEWMRCKDPVLEKKRVEFFKKKKAIN